MPRFFSLRFPFLSIGFSYPVASVWKNPASLVRSAFEKDAAVALGKRKTPAFDYLFDVTREHLGEAGI